MSVPEFRSSTARPRPWWLAPMPIAFGVIVVLASAAVFLQDVFFPPKPIDPRTHVVLPGGSTFCDTVPQPAALSTEGTPVPPAPLPKSK